MYPGGGANPAENSGGSVLRWYAAVLRRRWKWVAIGVLAGVLGGLLSTLAQHQSINPVQYFKATNTLTAPAEGSGQNAPNLQQAAYLINGEEVTAAIVKDTGLDADIVRNQLSATARPEVSAVEVTAVDTDPDQAVTLADAGAKALATYWQATQSQAYTKARDDINAKLEADQAKQADIQRQIDAAKPSDTALLAQLHDQLSSADNQYRTDNEALQALGPSGSTSSLVTLKPATPIEINGRGFAKRLSDIRNSQGQTSAVPPSAPTFSETDLAISPGVSRLVRMGLGGVAGLVLGLATAFLIEAWDDRIRRRDKLETLTGLPVLAEIPRLTKDQARNGVVVSVDSPRSRAAERYRAVRTSLLFALNDELNRKRPDGGKRAPVVLMTSPGPSEGKTTTTANLAAALGDNGMHVLVIDCDYHKPSIAKLLSPVLDPEHPDEPCATRLDGVEFIPAPHRDHQEISAVAQLHDTVEHWRDKVDLVLLDTPPMLTTNDATDLLAVSDVVVLVVRAGQTRSGAADRVMDLLVRFKAEPIGIVLNSADESDISALNYYGYGYGYYAHDADEVDHAGPAPSKPGSNGTAGPVPPNANGLAPRPRIQPTPPSPSPSSSPPAPPSTRPSD